MADKEYDSEDNPTLVRETLLAFSAIPPRYQHVPIWKIHGRYRKQMKRGYCKVLTLQSEKQRRNHNFSYKKIIWRTYYIKIS